MIDVQKVIEKIESELNYDDSSYFIEVDNSDGSQLALNIEHSFQQIDIDVTTDEYGRSEPGTETIYNEVYVRDITLFDAEGNVMDIENRAEIINQITKYFEL